MHRNEKVAVHFSFKDVYYIKSFTEELLKQKESIMTLDEKVNLVVNLMHEIDRLHLTNLNAEQSSALKSAMIRLNDGLSFAKTMSFRVGDVVEFADKSHRTGVAFVRGTVQKVNTKTIKIQQTNGLRSNPTWNVSGSLCTKV